MIRKMTHTKYNSFKKFESSSIKITQESLDKIMSININTEDRLIFYMYYFAL